MGMRTRGHGRWAVLGVALFAGGCSDRPTGASEATAGASDETASTTTTELSASGTSGASTGAVDSTASGSSSDEGSLDDGPWCSVAGDDAIAHCWPDFGGLTFECDVGAQDCPLGEKCAPWANDGGAAWNATQCVPVGPMPDPVGAACTVEGSAVSGLDSCDFAALCWNVDPATQQGECVAVCGYANGSLFCDDPATTCLVANDGAIVLCLPTCDPLLQSCGEGQLCVPGPEDEVVWAWACVPGSGTLGGPAEPCEFLNVCTPGSVCASAEVVPGCTEALGCCTPLCELGGTPCADPQTECTAWYELDSPPPGFEALGLCAATPEPPNDGWLPPGVDTIRARLP